MDGTALRESPLRLGSSASGLLRTLTMARPAKANAFDAGTVDALSLAFGAADGRPVAFAGEGRAFCGGFDFTGVEDQSPGDLLLRFVRIEALLQAVRASSVATFALVGGAAFGAGADLVAACAYRIGSPEAKFRFPGFRFGVALGTRHLARILGQDAARRVLLENRVVSAEEALELGLLTHLVDRAEMETKADSLAASHAGMAPAATERLLALTGADSRDADMADLVRSLAPDGLHDRIARYRAGHR